MISTLELRDYAALADMSYVDLTGVDLNSSQAIIDRAASEDEERTPSALGDVLLTDNWQAKDYYDLENDITGFAATTFRRGDEVVLAIRGSEPPLSSQLFEDWISSNFTGIRKSKGSVSIDFNVKSLKSNKVKRILIHE